MPRWKTPAGSIFAQRASKLLYGIYHFPQDDIYGKEENILIGTMYTWGMDIKNICALNLERLQPRGHIPEIVQSQNHI